MHAIVQNSPLGYGRTQLGVCFGNIMHCLLLSVVAGGQATAQPAQHVSSLTLYGHVPP